MSSFSDLPETQAEVIIDVESLIKSRGKNNTYFFGPVVVGGSSGGGDDAEANPARVLFRFFQDEAERLGFDLPDLSFRSFCSFLDACSTPCHVDASYEPADMTETETETEATETESELTESEFSQASQSE